jgi:hypothetical protein
LCEWQATHKREEEDRDEVLDLLGQAGSEAGVMRHDDANEEASKDGVDADDRGDKGAGEDEGDDKDHDALGRSLFEGTVPVQEAQEERPDDVDEEEGPANGAEEDVEDRDAGAGIDESDGQGEKDPADDIVADARGENRDANVVLQEAKLGEDAGQDGCDRNVSVAGTTLSGGRGHARKAVMDMATPMKSTK